MAKDISELRAHVDLLRYVKQEKARLKIVEDESKAAVLEGLGTADEGEIDGQVVVRVKTVKSNRLDQKLLEQMHPGAALECRSMTTSTRFEVVE
ncbi:hypothetical protein PBI_MALAGASYROSE_57 [Mycobacterium phage MalagasyRose]|uniref:Uncharacterized protein n=1 Tax=Mycobacterium phage MalagasyRose TaxID=2599870 RepID=A0A5J6TE78_9CAUD|nr:hypothetical protein QEH39_gp31 [Mycobacterium phage MalagasyRose]QFG08905.1 hypothetical protein PBI_MALAGASYROSE_57 [Mycobacterium phage MalagasyRose]